MTVRRLTTVAFTALLASAAPVSAQTVHNGGAPNGQAGFDIFNDFRSTDDFTFTTATAFDVIRFWGILPTGFTYTPTIFWQILADAGASPGTSAVTGGSTLAQATLRTSLDNGFDSWQFDLLVGPQLVGSGVYWLALHDGPIGDITDSSLIWEMTNGGSGAPFATEFLGEWAPFDGNLAFELQSTPSPVNTVPEPATLTLLATGLAGLGAMRRRSRTPNPQDNA